MFIGTDIVFVPDFVAQLEVPGSRFADVFTERELRYCRGRANPDASLAARWAAKEAYLKAWSNSRYGAPPALGVAGAGVAGAGAGGAGGAGVAGALNFAEIEVVPDAFGRVAIALRGSLASIAPPTASLSISHDGDYAIAVCVVGAPAPG